MEIQSYTEDRAREITDLFHQSIHAADPSVYSLEQKEAWAPSPPDYRWWLHRLNEKKPFLAIVEDRVAGFMELEPDGHIDCLYTHPEFQQQGVASALFQHSLYQAKTMKATHLVVEASHVAKSFFEKRGFTVIKKNEVTRRSVVLVNYTMERRLL